MTTSDAAAGQRGTQPWTERLRDGRQVIIRPLRPEDAEAERAFIKALSPQSRRARFLGQVSEFDDALIKQLTDIDQVTDVALAAVVPEDGCERIVGVSRYSASPERDRCECAVVVADDWQRKGLGTMLMNRLIDTAKRSGIRAMDSIDLAQNHDMHDLARGFGFSARADPDDACNVIYTLQLDGTPHEG